MAHHVNTNLMVKFVPLQVNVQRGTRVGFSFVELSLNNERQIIEKLQREYGRIKT